jgi:hypothetical protein
MHKKRMMGLSTITNRMAGDCNLKTGVLYFLSNVTPFFGGGNKIITIEEEYKWQRI